ncbi:MAG: MurR/RpiR family transcriptional regulator, partial [Rubellimicrobium sp.]|nr:MurR/RpiR family transcriptional regulator [Rubellimicrobium sp.]
RPPEASAVDIIVRLKRRQSRGKEAERRLVDTILADLQFAAQASIAQLAQRAGVSEPTITRLARSMGFAGTQDMRAHLTQALAVGGAYLRSPPAPPEGAAAYGGAVAAIAQGAHSALDLFTLGLSGTDLEVIARTLRRAGSILVCGTGGGSSMAAVEMQTRFFRLGLRIVAQTDPQLQRMSASVLGPRDVAVGFSISGQARSVIDALQIARQYGAQTLAVTQPGTPLAQAARTILPFTFREDGNIYKPSSSRYALLAAVDILAMATAHAIGGDVIEPLRRVRQSLASQNIVNPDLPIGD